MFGSPKELAFFSGFVTRRVDEFAGSPAWERWDDTRREFLERSLRHDSALHSIRTELAEAASFLNIWAPVIDAGLLQTVPTRPGIRAWVLDSRFRSLATPGPIDSAAVEAALRDLPPQIRTEQALGMFAEFNFELLLARAANGSPVARDEISWRYLCYLAGIGESYHSASEARAHRMLELAPLPGVGRLRPEDALRLHDDVDEFADWHLRLRNLGRELSEGSPSAVEARELLEEELAPAVRRLRNRNRLSAVADAVPTQGLSMAFGAVSLIGLAALGTPITEAALEALPMAAASQLAITAIQGQPRRDSAVLARLVKVDSRRPPGS